MVGAFPGRRLVAIGLTVMFVLIGIGVVLFAVLRPAPTLGLAFFGFPFSLFGFFFLVWFFFWIFGPWRWWRWGWGHPYGHYGWWSRDPALELLRERYARGELTREQYQQMVQDLGPRT